MQMVADGHAQRPSQVTKVSYHPCNRANANKRQERYFTRVNVVVLQNTAATQPERSRAVLLLTVTVPE
jgi:hypothetical protein